MRKIKSYLILCLILFTTVSYSGCVSEQHQDKKLELTDIDQHTITKIYIRNGLSGELTITNDSVKIEELSEQLDSYSLEKMEIQEPLVGYRYSIDFYRDSNKISSMTIVGPKTIEIDGIYYNVTNPPVDLEAIDELVDSISEQPQEPGITELTDIDQHTITKIYIRNGLSGEVTTTNDSIKIDELIEQLDKYSLRIKENQKPIVGQIYLIEIYSDSNKISSIAIIDSFIMRIDGVYYDVIDPHIDLVAIEELVDSM
ncbi:hypothetical protein [Methanococcoides methylutens]|uniref:Uncharacterized protein n=1 Tax=Methanococcoides methylutens MM1 TaxID=1434104 RepID=A0A0E3SQ96_METMT|nr:hypothetical protein [Methanococcoides methylutens]AKB84152.1 hypothetical protein MCMEM_0099 [Methanococcoides methylutens MM1]